MKRMAKWAALLGMAALCFGMAPQQPAAAQAGRGIYLQGDIYHDRTGIHRNTAHLRRLRQDRRNALALHNWHGAHFYGSQVRHTRHTIWHDRRDLRHDLAARRRYRRYHHW